MLLPALAASGPGGLPGGAVGVRVRGLLLRLGPLRLALPHGAGVQLHVLLAKVLGPAPRRAVLALGLGQPAAGAGAALPLGRLRCVVQRVGPAAALGAVGRVCLERVAALAEARRMQLAVLEGVAALGRGLRRGRGAPAVPEGRPASGRRCGRCRCPSAWARLLRGTEYRRSAPGGRCRAPRAQDQARSAVLHRRQAHWASSTCTKSSSRSFIAKAPERPESGALLGLGAPRGPAAPLGGARYRALHAVQQGPRTHCLAV